MNIIKQNILVFPFQYMFYSRGRLWMNRLSFIAMVLNPILLNIGMMREWQFSLLEFILGIISLFSVYEIGYIYNDIYATTREVDGRQWLDNEHLQDTKRKYPIYIAARVLYTSLSIFVLCSLKCPNTHWFVLFLGILYLVYTAHNYIRGPLNTITFMLLYILKYSMTLILFTVNWMEFAAYSTFLFLEIVLERTVAYGNKKKYIFKSLKSFDSDKNRLKRCLITLIISGFITILNPFFKSFLFGILYVFCYRIICYLLSHFDRFKNRTMLG